MTNVLNTPFHLRYYSVTILFFTITLLFSYSCSGRKEVKEELSQSDRIALKQEIDSLKTDAQKRLYLESIFKKDQAVRDYDMQTAQQDKDNSEANLDALQLEFDQKMHEQDILNLFCVKYYLSLYGHPTLDTYGEIASYAPLLVFHHKANMKEFENHYSLFYQAYEQENIAPSKFSFTLRAFHQKKYREKYTPESTNETEIIMDLIDKLNLAEN